MIVIIDIFHDWDHVQYEGISCSAAIIDSIVLSVCRLQIDLWYHKVRANLVDHYKRGPLESISSWSNYKTKDRIAAHKTWSDNVFRSVFTDYDHKQIEDANYTSDFDQVSVISLAVLGATLVEGATQSHWSPVSSTEIAGLLCGIQKYGSLDFWTSHNQRIVKTTLQKAVRGYGYVAPVV